MQQLEIQYFFPLTEQIPLDLDFTESIAYTQKKHKPNFVKRWIYKALGMKWKAK